MGALATLFARGLGLIFLLVAVVMLLAPERNLASDGISFDSFTIAGRAEVRAYYFGTALALAWIMMSADLSLALQTIRVVLGGFASARVCGYAKDGVDANASLRLHQHCIFCVEVIGCATAAFFLARRAGDTVWPTARG